MLTRLAIRNVVLIEAAELTFEPGLCVLSGETGAGKSILLDALGLVLGMRAEARLVRHGERQATVTAEFDLAARSPVMDILQELGLENEGPLILRRVLSSDGKTRCFVNDQPVSVGALRSLGEALVEIHGQHDQRGLLDVAGHRVMLDAFGGLDSASARVADAWKIWRETLSALSAKREALQRAEREQEYLRHALSELERLSPREGEEDELAERRARMMQAEKTAGAVSEALAEVSQGRGVTGALHSAQRILLRLKLDAAHPLFAAADALERAATESEEAARRMEEYLEAIGDPAELERAEERLFALRAAARKHGVTPAELPGLLQKIAGQVGAHARGAGEVAALARAEAAARAAYVAAAEALSKGRAKAAAKLEKVVEAELKPLKMERTRFRVRMQTLSEEQWGAHGVESVAFEAATNAPRSGEPPFAPLQKIASGGELSRFMLAMKVAMHGLRSAPTLIFDEIDTGTGGAVADAIGRRLMELGKGAQVLVVTHLPQIAARGNVHFSVSKQERRGAVHTSIERLSAKAREEELARMLSGATVTAEARRAAAKLLEHAA